MGLTTKLLRTERPRQYFKFALNYFRGIRVNQPPILIVGCGHSGTSLLLRILDMHPEIYGIPYESRAFLKSSIKIRLARWFWEKNTIAAGKHRWVEKTPNHIHAIVIILEQYPNAKILLMIRDGRDVAVSLRKRTGSFADGVTRWVNDNSAGEPFWDHPQVFKLAYEDLVGRFEETALQICEFLNVPYDAAMRDFHQRKMKLFGTDKHPHQSGTLEVTHNQLRNWQINQKLFDGSRKWQVEMSPEERLLFKQVAGEMLIRYGYESDMNW